MRGVEGLAGAALIVAAWGVSCGAAEAQDDRVSEPARFLYFSGADLWSNGSFVHGGLLWAKNGLDTEGLVFKVLVGGGSYRYRSGALGGAEVTGRQIEAFALAGWRFQRRAFTLTVFAGPDVQRHVLSPYDPGSSLHGTKLGIRTALELWYEPTPEMMMAADASVSSVGGSYSARAALGWRIADAWYLGPEIQGFAEDDYRQVRLGLHVTGVRAADMEWSAAAGYARDSDGRGGAYGRVGVIARR